MSETKISKWITSYRLLKLQQDLQDGMITHNAYMSVYPAGNAFAGSATPLKQPKSERSESLKDEKEKALEKGVKFDDGKPAVAFIPKAAMFAEGQAFAYGAKKYADWNYKKGIPVTKTIAAAIRHLMQFMDGEELDFDPSCDQCVDHSSCDKHSWAHHLGCARANIAIALDTLEHHSELDDRFKGDKK